MKSALTGIVVFGLIAVMGALSCLNQQEGKQNMPATVSYNFHIRPILSDKCFKCHGPDASKRKASLRLDIADSAYATLKETKGGFAIIPGKPEAS